MAHIDTTYLVLFSANLAFIVTHIYGWLLKWFYRPKAYAEHRKRTHLLLLFYDMISQHRVRYAISLIHQHPDRRLADIAEQCGFSSQASMTKAFKAQGKGTPSSNR